MSNVGARRNLRWRSQPQESGFGSFGYLRAEALRWVTTGPHGRGSPAFRLWFDETLSLELKHAFLMSYMRSLEGSLSAEGDVEYRIPFWEFLDIEFDRENRVFRFAAYYAVRPAFPHLFKRLIGSPAMKRIDEA